MSKNLIEGEHPAESEQALLEGLIHQYACAIDKEPQWCVYGEGLDGGRGVLFWIKPSDEEEFIARKIAKLVSKLGGNAEAHMTEWNPNLKGKPIEDQEGHLNYILGGKNKKDS
ncbi:MAG: hypothetical protein Q7S28_03085 [bacterium]|nr:hypothetical protein [bacterium]